MNSPSALSAAQWRQAGLWRGRDVPAVARGVSTGYAALDRVLPGQGWPTGGLIEILGDFSTAGGLRLLMPALARLSGTRRWLAWIAPPYIPYAPALVAQGVDLSRVLWVHPRSTVDNLWVAEQALRSRTCNAVLVWAHDMDARHLRRLQLALEGQGCVGVVFRPTQAATEASPAVLRLQVSAAPEGVDINLLKCRGAWASGALRVDWNDVMAGPLSSSLAAGDIHTYRTA